MELLSWELQVLSKAVAYKNLSAAAMHVGLSQPQLSRIIKRIEERVGMPLLDRSAKRNSAFTPMALQLAELHGRSARSFQSELDRLVNASGPSLLRIGTLEGQLELASEGARKAFSWSGLTTVELDVYDLNELEAKFLAGDLDAILSLREPARRKFTYQKIVGYQTLEHHTQKSENPIRVVSSYEYSSAGRQKRKDGKDERVLISNSLAVRKHWISSGHAIGAVPSEIYKKPRGTRLEFPVVLVAQENVPEKLWKAIVGS